MQGDLLERTAAFHKAAVACIGNSQPREDKRAISAYQCALMSVEHATGALALLSIGLPNAAMALFRPQFETLVRGVWLLEAADEKWVLQYHEPLSQDSGRAAENAPGVNAMFDLLLKLGEPRVQGVIANLDQYRALNWGALNSFTHGGMHPMARSGAGYTDELVDNVIRNANALVCLAAQIAALVSADPQACMVPVRKLHEDFRDCIPLA